MEKSNSGKVVKEETGVEKGKRKHKKKEGQEVRKERSYRNNAVKAV